MRDSLIGSFTAIGIAPPAFRTKLIDLLVNIISAYYTHPICLNKGMGWKFIPLDSGLIENHVHAPLSELINLISYQEVLI